jgi:hypothetical protein
MGQVKVGALLLATIGGKAVEAGVKVNPEV